MSAMIRVAILFAALWISAQAQAQGAQENKILDAVSRPGIATDSRGGAVIDPTKNVEDLVRAEMKRQDDLRDAAKQLFDAKLELEGRLSEQRSKFDRELLKAAVERLDEQAKLRAEFASTIATTEKGRVDAIRLVDKNAVDVATAQAVATATALAKTVQDSAAVLSTQGTRQAEDLRTLVATTAAEQSRNLQQQFTALTTRISALEQAGAEGKGRQLPPDPIIVSLMAQVTALAQAGSEGRGKAALQDPAISALTAQVAALLQARTNQTGTEQGRSDIIGWIVGGIGMLIAFLGMIAAFMRLRQAPAAA